ncbi:MAG: helix-turn-helix domain-containing protein [Actinomycetota bacterium]|nr:helix-turn-helix domain-containing protein [Actinomycetota bacterium]
MNKNKDNLASKYLLSIDEAAMILGITRATAYRAINNNTFPVAVVKIGGRMKVVKQALLNFLADNHPCQIGNSCAIRCNRESRSGYSNT